MAVLVESYLKNSRVPTAAMPSCTPEWGEEVLTGVRLRYLAGLVFCISYTGVCSCPCVFIAPVRFHVERKILSLLFHLLHVFWSRPLKGGFLFKGINFM